MAFPLIELSLTREGYNEDQLVFGLGIIESILKQLSVNPPRRIEYDKYTGRYKWMEGKSNINEIMSGIGAHEITEEEYNNNVPSQLKHRGGGYSSWRLENEGTNYYIDAIFTGASNPEILKGIVGTAIQGESKIHAVNTQLNAVYETPEKVLFIGNINYDDAYFTSGIYVVKPKELRSNITNTGLPLLGVAAVGLLTWALLKRR
jgi:hypothetical protein